jgi:hypothetical protein
MHRRNIQLIPSVLLTYSFGAAVSNLSRYHHPTHIQFFDIVFASLFIFASSLYYMKK